MDTPAHTSNFAGGLSEIGGYSGVAELTAGQTWRARAAGGREVVLKALDDDCLWNGQLHPNVKDRLSRVRELAHVGVANLYGVERDAGLTYLVWEYVAGQTLAERAASASACPPRDLLLLARELVLAVEMLHARGIVHGALKASNVIVDADGRIVLTHVSPLLYTEPAEDVAALQELLGDLLEQRGESDSPLGRLLDDVGDTEVPLRRLAGRLGALLESRDAEGAAGGGAVEDADRVQAKAIRRRAVVAAGAIVVAGVVLFAGLRHYGNARTPRPPVPPQAAPAALRPAQSSSAPPSPSITLARGAGR
jgi:hypothetical protein